MSKGPYGNRVLLRGIILAVFAAAIYVVNGRYQSHRPPPTTTPHSETNSQQTPQANSPSSVDRDPLSKVAAKPDSSTPTTPSTQPTATPKTSTAVRSNLVIASWNIEWLGKPNDRSGPARGRAQSPTDLAECLASTGASIIALQEIIATASSTPPRSKELDALLPELNRQLKGEWDYVLFPGRNADDQSTGVMWNTSVVQAKDASDGEWDDSDSPYRVPVKSGRSAQGSGLWHRPPHAMKFSAGEGRSDVVVIVLHMKADYQGDFAAHRAEEATALTATLAGLRAAFKDDDLIVLGDTNCVQVVEPALDAFAQAGLRDLNVKNEQTHWRGGAMDRILVAAGQPEFAASSFSVASDRFLERKRWKPEDFKRTLSDHYPVYATITIDADDD